VTTAQKERGNMVTLGDLHAMLDAVLTRDPTLAGAALAVEAPDDGIDFFDRAYVAVDENDQEITVCLVPSGTT